MLIAVGGDDPNVPFMPGRTSLAPDETARSWRDFLDGIETDGNGPEWVVADGAKAIASAVMRRWPNAIFYNCAFHLRRAMCEAAKTDGIWTDDRAHKSLFEQAFWTDADWQAITTWAKAKPAPNLLNWITTNDALIRQQIVFRGVRTSVLVYRPIPARRPGTPSALIAAIWHEPVRRDLASPTHHAGPRS